MSVEEILDLAVRSGHRWTCMGMSYLLISSKYSITCVDRAVIPYGEAV